MSDDRALRILVYGDSKVGKSWFANTAPGPRLIFDVEGKTRFLPGIRKRWNPLKEAVPVLDGTWDTVVVSVTNYAVLEAGVKAVHENPHPFQSIIIDSLSELQRVAMEDVVGRAQMKIQDWGELLRKMNFLVRDLCTMVEHETYPVKAVIGIAQAMEFEGKKTPQFQGNFKNIVSYAWDITGYMYKDQLLDETGNRYTARLMRLGGEHTKYEVGENVGGMLPDIVEDPNVEDFLVAVFGPEEGE